MAGEGEGRELREGVRAGERADEALAPQVGRARPRSRALRPGAYEAYAAQPDELAPELVVAAQSGDEHARGLIVEACMPRVAAMARVYRGGARVERQELLQEGVVGVLRALERYDPERGVPFWGYATWWVRQAMQQLVAELARPVVLSDRALRELARVKEAHADVLQQQSAAPSPQQLADHTGLQLSQVEELLAADRPQRALDAPLGQETAELGTLGELLADPLAEDAYEQILTTITASDLHTLLRGLSERERGVLRARYGLDGPAVSMRELGGRLGVSAERIRQIEHRALGKLAARFEGAA